MEIGLKIQPRNRRNSTPFTKLDDILRAKTYSEKCHRKKNALASPKSQRLERRRIEDAPLTLEKLSRNSLGNRKSLKKIQKNEMIKTTNGIIS